MKVGPSKNNIESSFLTRAGPVRKCQIVPFNLAFASGHHDSVKKVVAFKPWLELRRKWMLFMSACKKGLRLPESIWWKSSPRPEEKNNINKNFLDQIPGGEPPEKNHFPGPEQFMLALLYFKAQEILNINISERKPFGCTLIGSPKSLCQKVYFLGPYKIMTRKKVDWDRLFKLAAHLHIA